MNLPPFLDIYNLMFLGQALLVTLAISLVGLSGGALLGLVIGLLREDRINQSKLLRWLIIIFVESGRRVPFLVLLFVVVFGLQISGWHVSSAVGATVAVLLRTTVYFSETVRSGVEAVPQSQWDAAITMNLSRLRIIFSIVIPQAFPLIIAPATVLFVQLVKSTSIASQVGVIELTAAAKLLNVRGYSALLCFGTLLCVYYVLSMGIWRIGDFLQRRLARGKAQPASVLLGTYRE